MEQIDTKEEETDPPTATKAEETAPPTATKKEETVTATKDEETAAKQEETATANKEEETATPQRVDFTGHWKNYKNENLEEFLYVMNMNYFIRKIAARVHPAQEIIQDGDKFQVKLIMVIFTQETKFVIGEEFQMPLPGGDVFKAVASWEGEKLVIHGSPVDPKSDKKSAKVIREMIDNDLVMTFITGDCVCKRFFKRTK